MKLPAKYACFYTLCFLSISSFAQQAFVPAKVSASYKKYPNRIELSWQATAADHQYIVQRRERTQKFFARIDTVAQNRYVDRNKLQVNTDYVYCVQALPPNGTASAPSAEAIGALLAVAADKNTLKDTMPLSSCIPLRIMEAKASAQYFVLKFLVAPAACADLQVAQLSLYHSADALLDDQDRFLARQSFLLSRTRGALTAKQQGGPAQGYLLLRVEAKGREFTLSSKIE